VEKNGSRCTEVPQREALDPAVRFVNEFDNFASFLAAAIAHEPSIGGQMAKMLARTVAYGRMFPNPKN
jgi:hypothetical protein